MQIKIVVVVVLLIFKTFLNNIIMASHSNKNKKWKIKDLITEELLREQPFYSSYIEKPKSRNLSIEELLSEQPFCKQPIKTKKRKKKI